MNKLTSRINFMIAILVSAAVLSTLSGCYKVGEGKNIEEDNTTDNIKGNGLNEIPKSIYEAEEGILYGTEKSTKTLGYSGDGYVTGFDSEGDAVEVEVEVLESGFYDLIVGYCSPNDNKICNLFVNDQPSGDIILERTSEFAELDPVKIELNEGSNRIKILKGWGWYDIDYFKITNVIPISLPDVPKALVNPNATKEAKALMSFLVDNYGRKIISGQQDYEYINWIEKNTGKKPAILGLDFMDYSPSRVEFGATSRQTEKAIQWWEQGGIVAFCWHWNAPKDLINKPGKEWWRGFYTEATEFDLDYALNNKDSEDYRLIIRDIDAIAEQLKILQDAKVPILWRPLHEAGGKWFWWGAKGSEPCKELYLILYDRLTNYHGLNNLIWVWSTPEPEWYPGDDYVDIVAYDSYPSQGGYDPVAGIYEKLVELVNGKKLIAMSENGPIPDPDRLLRYSARWSWFCTWGDMISDPDKNEPEHVKRVYNHGYVITHDDLPDIENYVD